MTGKVIVAGALGLAGRAAVSEYERLGRDVIGLSRRRPEDPGSTAYLAVDLSDAADCRAKLADIRRISHIVFCALYEKPNLVAGWSESDHARINLGMLANLLDAVEGGNPALRHVSLLQGAKAYGIHLGPAIPPMKEDRTRHLHANFYWEQEDFIRRRSSGSSWTWTIFRPQGIVGYGIGSAMNLVSVIGVYAAVCRELGLPLSFPGTGQDLILQATDARLLGRAFAWAGGAEEAAAQIFNVTNGDVFTWHELWPIFARRFGIEPGLPQPVPLAGAMADKGPIWQAITRKHDLKLYTLDALIGPAWQAADFAFSTRHGAKAQIMSTIKIRQSGFPDCIDSADSFDWWLGELQRRRILPH